MVIVAKDESSVVNCEAQHDTDRRQRLRQRFQVVKKLGQGTYGKVQLAINKDTKQEVAIKTIRKDKIENEQDLTRIRREIQIMSSVHHPHIIHIYEVFENSEKIVLIMQYASGGELYDYLGCHRKLPERESRRIFRQVATAIYYCHQNKICHRDLKLENILLDDKGNAKIADFGLSNVFDERKMLRTFCGSPLYASPEIVKGTPYRGPEVDCWSLGVLLYTLVYGAMPFDGSNFKRLVKQISEGDYHEPKQKSNASGIIRHLLTVDVKHRASVKDICTDSWVNEGYEQSLLRVASDMAKLSPVSLNTLLPRLSSASTAIGSVVEHNNFNDPYSFKEGSINASKNDNSCQLKGIEQHHSTNNERLHPDPINSALTNGCQKSDVIFQQRDENNVSLEKPCADFIADVKAEMTRIPEKIPILNLVQVTNVNETCDNNTCNNTSNSTQQDIQRPSESHPRQVRAALNANSQNVHRNFDATYDNKVLCHEKLSCNQKESQISTNLYVEKGHVSLIGNDDYGNHISNDILGKINVSNTEVLPKTDREKITEQLRSWRAGFDKTCLTNQNEPDSIVPIFNVTSVIPKRTKEASCSSEKSNTSEDNKVGANSNKSTFALTTAGILSEDNDLCGNTTKSSMKPYFTGNILMNECRKQDGTLKTVNTLERDASKEKNEVIDYINNILSTGKLSSQIEKHSVSDAKEWRKVGSEIPEVTAYVGKNREGNDDQIGNICESVKDLKDMEDMMFVRPDASCLSANKETREDENLPTIQSQDVRATELHVEPLEVEKYEHEQHDGDHIVNDSNSYVKSGSRSNVNISLDQCKAMRVCCTENDTPASVVPSRMSMEREESDIPFDHRVMEKLEASRKLVISTDNVNTVLCNSDSSATIEQQLRRSPSPEFAYKRQSLRDTVKSTVTHEATNMKPKAKDPSKRKLKTRSFSVSNEQNSDSDLRNILRRPRKYSLCALLAATFELEQAARQQTRRESDPSRKVPGKVTIPKYFDPSSESESTTPVEKKDIVLIPSISVAENKQKIERKIEKVKLSALSMKTKRKSDVAARRKIKKYTRSNVDALHNMMSTTMTNEGINLLQNGSPSVHSDELNPLYNESDDFQPYDSSEGQEFGENTDDGYEDSGFGFSPERDSSENYWNSEYCNESMCYADEGMEPRFLEPGNDDYVPIRRCCKKMTFPPKPIGEKVQKSSSFTEKGVVNDFENYVIQQLQSNTDNIRSSHMSLNLKGDSGNQFPKNKFEKTGLTSVHSADFCMMDSRKNAKPTKSSKSLYSNDSLISSSLDRDSSDNDDELDDIIIGSNLDLFKSEDLWKYLKTLNDDPNRSSRKVKRSQSVFSRSSSQECRCAASTDQYCHRKALARSRSKEEKQNLSIHGTSVDSLPKCSHCFSSSELSHPPRCSNRCNIQRGEFHTDRGCARAQKCEIPVIDDNNEYDSSSNYSLTELMRAKYRSLSNLERSRTFLSSGNLNYKNNGANFKSCETIPGGDSTEVYKKRDVILSRDVPAGSTRQGGTAENRLSKSQVALNAKEDLCAPFDEKFSTVLQAGCVNRKEHPRKLRTKALSDLNITFAELTDERSSLNPATKDKDALRFAKSLGSRLNLEPYDSSHDPPTKGVHKRDERVHHKRGRRVSFMESTRNTKNNFALESMAKAQMALNDIDKVVPEERLHEDSGTLLEALKNHGYKSIISQRLQQSDICDTEDIKRRYSLACLRKLVHLNSSDLDPADYVRRMHWTELLNFQGMSDYNIDDNEYCEPVNTNVLYTGRLHGEEGVSRRKLPGKWLYQNVGDFRLPNIPDEIPTSSNWVAEEPQPVYTQIFDYDVPEVDRRIRNWNTNKQSVKHFKPRGVSTQENVSSSHTTQKTAQAKSIDSSIEKLAMRIQALKNRCSQKSFDESPEKKAFEIEPQRPSEMNGFCETIPAENEAPGETQSFLISPELSLSERKEKESVRDRIWRKSFYSRFNDIPVLRRRRSMLLEPELDSINFKPTKFRNSGNTGVDDVASCAVQGHSSTLPHKGRRLLTDLDQSYSNTLPEEEKVKSRTLSVKPHTLPKHNPNTESLPPKDDSDNTNTVTAVNPNYVNIPVENVLNSIQQNTDEKTL